MWNAHIAMASLSRQSINDSHYIPSQCTMRRVTRSKNDGILELFLLLIPGIKIQDIGLGK
jgi:hypothetical protein